MTRARGRRVDASLLVWGLFFGCLAALGLWYGLGRAVNWRLVSTLAPLVLMAIGGIGLLAGSRRR